MLERFQLQDKVAMSPARAEASAPPPRSASPKPEATS